MKPLKKIVMPKGQYPRKPRKNKPGRPPGKRPGIQLSENPTWLEIAPLLVEMLEKGTDRERTTAKFLLHNMAHVADYKVRRLFLRRKESGK